MGEAFLDYKKGGASGLDINGIIEDYYVYAGEKVSTGDFVEFINGVAEERNYGTSVDTAIATTNYYAHKMATCKISENKILVIHGNTNSIGTPLYGIICTVNGATITKGTDVQLTTDAPDFYSCCPVLLPSGKVFVAYSQSAGQINGMILSITGQSITVEASAKVISDAYTAERVSAVVLPNGDVFISHSKKGTPSSARRLAGFVVTIDGATITKGTDTIICSDTVSGTSNSMLLPDGKVFIAHTHSSGYLYGTICVVDGITITPGTNTALNSSANSGEGKPVLLQDGKVFIAYSYSTNYYLHGIVCSVSGTTITAGTDVALNDSIGETGSAISLAMLKNGKIFIAHRYLDNTSGGYGRVLYGMIVTVKDAIVTHGTDTPLTSGVRNTGMTLSAEILDNGTIFVAHSYDSYYHLYAQIWGVDETTNVPTNEIIALVYETQVRPATSLPCNGVAKNSGEGGDETAHNEQVSIYVPELGVK
jgi:hypothetical protein